MLECPALVELEEYLSVFLIVCFSFLVELTNSQVMLKGSENKRALLITSANTQILKRLHRPVAANNDVVLKLNKVTWTGKLDNVQVSGPVFLSE